MLIVHGLVISLVAFIVLLVKIRSQKKREDLGDIVCDIIDKMQLISRYKIHGAIPRIIKEEEEKLEELKKKLVERLKCG